MRISQYGMDRYFPFQYAVEVRLAEAAVAVAYLGQHPAVDAKEATQLLVPLQGMDIEQLGAGSIGIIGFKVGSTGQLIDQPAVNCSQMDPFFALTLPFSRSHAIFAAGK